MNIARAGSLFLTGPHILALVLFGTGCDDPAALSKAASPHEGKDSGSTPPDPSSPVAVTSDGKPLDDSSAATIAAALHALQTQTPESATEEDKNQAKNPARILGAWKIQHTLHRTNGKRKGKSNPLVPVTWRFTKKGKLLVKGGNDYELDFIYTGKRIITTGLGPKQSYTVSRLTKTRLDLTSRIEAGSTLIQNTVVLQRLKGRKKNR